MENNLMEYFIRETNKRFDKIDKKLEQLITFRLMLMGGALAISAVASVAVNLIMIWLKVT